MKAALVRIIAPIATSVIYFAAAAFSVHYSRFGGGVAMIWIASAVLAARLAVIPLHEWAATVGLCAVASAIATGWMGLGWIGAGPLALVNMAEAMAAALVIRHLSLSYWPHETFELVAGYYFGLGLIIPALSALFGASVATFVTDVPFETNFFHWMVGHSVGLLAILPFTATIAAACQRGVPLVPHEDRLTGLLLCTTMLVLTFGVFSQPVRPFMLAPLLLTMLAAVWANMVVVMALPTILALVGGVLTLYGLGPMGSLAFDPGDRIQLFQLYVAITVLCAMPVCAEQERRRRDMRRLMQQESHWRQISGQAGERLAELEKATSTDPLTGLPSRRHFEEAMTAVVRSGRKGCIALIGIRDFTELVDRHGVYAGREVLLAVGTMAAKALPDTVLVARLEGDEFAILFHDAGIEQAEQTVIRMIEELSHNPILTRTGALRIGFGCGMAELHESGEAALVVAARTLYKSKPEPAAQRVVAA